MNLKNKLNTPTPREFINSVIKKYGNDYKESYYWKSSGRHTLSSLTRNIEPDKEPEVKVGKCPLDTICNTCGLAIKKDSNVKKIDGEYHHYECK